MDQPDPELVREWQAGEPVLEEWWEVARTLGWRGPVGGWGPGVDQPQAPEHLKDRYAIEEALRAWGWGVEGITVISPQSSEIRGPDDRKTTVSFPIDHEGNVIDTRLPFFVRAFQASAVVMVTLEVRLDEHGERQWYGSTTVWDTVKNHLTVGGGYADPLAQAGVYASSPYNALYGVLRRVTDENHQLRRRDRLPDLQQTWSDEQPTPTPAPSATAPTAAGQADAAAPEATEPEMTPEQRRAYNQARLDELFAHLERDDPPEENWIDLDPDATIDDEASVTEAEDAVQRVRQQTLAEALAEVQAATERLDQLTTQMEAGAVTVDPTKGAELLRDLLTAESNLTNLVMGLDQRADAYNTHHANLVRSTQIATDNLVRAQDAKAVQDFLVNLASLLADLASVKDLIDEWNAKLEIDSGLTSDLADDLDGSLGADLDSLYEGLKDVESAVNTLIGQVDEDAQSPIFNDLLGLVPGLDEQIEEAGGNPMLALQTWKSHLSDVKSLVETIRETGVKDWGNFRSGGQLLFRVIKSGAEWSQALRQAHIAQLEQSIDAEQGVYADTFIPFLAFSEEKFVANDHLTELRSSRLHFQELLGAQAPGISVIGPLGTAALGSPIEAFVSGITRTDLLAGVEALAATAAPEPDPLSEGACDACGEAAARLVDARAQLATARASNDAAELRFAQALLTERQWQLDLCVRMLCDAPAATDTLAPLRGGLDDDLIEVTPQLVAACPSCQHIANEITLRRLQRGSLRARLGRLERAAQAIERLRRAVDQLRHQRNLLDIRLSSARATRSSVLETLRHAEVDEEIRDLENEHSGLTRQIENLLSQIAGLESARREIPLVEEEIRLTQQQMLFLEQLLDECERTRCGGLVAPMAPTSQEEYLISPPVDEESERRGCLSPAMITGLILTAIVAGVGMFALLSGGDEEAATTPAPAPLELEDTPEPDPTPLSPLEPPPAGEPATDDPAAPWPDVAYSLGATGDAPAAARWVEDLPGGITWSIPTEQGVERPSSTIERTAAWVSLFDEDLIVKLFGNTSYPCGAVTESYRVTCPDESGVLSAGEYIVVVSEHAGEVAEGSGQHTYGLAFDDDGDRSDNYVPSDPFTADFFAHTEHWYQLQVDADSTRRVWADGIRDGAPGFPRYSSAAVIEVGTTVIWVIPRAEVPGDELGYRTTSFHNDGDPDLVPDPATSGGDVSGLGVDEPLLPVDTAPIPFTDLAATPPDTPGTSARVEPPADPDAYITSVLVADFEDRANAAFALDDLDAALDLVLPVLFTLPRADECRTLVETTIALADALEITTIPTVAAVSQGVVFYQTVADLEYPTGTVEFGPVLTPGPGGRLYLLFPECTG